MNKKLIVATIGAIAVTLIVTSLFANKLAATAINKNTPMTESSFHTPLTGLSMLPLQGRCTIPSTVPRNYILDAGEHRKEIPFTPPRTIPGPSGRRIPVRCSEAVISVSGGIDWIVNARIKYSTPRTRLEPSYPISAEFTIRANTATPSTGSRSGTVTVNGVAFSISQVGTSSPPDFAITNIVRQPGGRLLVIVRNDGAAGVITGVSCSSFGRSIDNSERYEMGNGAEQQIYVNLAPPVRGSVRCDVGGVALDGVTPDRNLENNGLTKTW